ncbi:unnamed protein product, partial [Rotaria magnacalcarata]
MSSEEASTEDSVDSFSE